MRLYNFIDIHSHMDDAQFNSQQETILKDFFSSSNNKLVTIADPSNEKSMEISKKVADLFPNVYLMTAAHPHQAAKYSKYEEMRIFSLLSHPKLIGIGESGLDLHYNFSSFEEQKKVFKRQIAIAKEKNMPLLVHSRKAEKEILTILEKNRFQAEVLFHCFTGTQECAEEILKRGYYLSFSGIITFNKSSNIRSVLKKTNLKQLFLETDSPYLSPEPHRGKTNTPQNVSIVYTTTAQIKEISIEDLAIQIEMNFKSMFRI